MIFAIFTTAIRIRNKIAAKDKKSSEFLGDIRMVIGCIEEDGSMENILGIWRYLMANTEIRRNMDDINVISIVDKPNGWFGVKAVK